jgi:glycosyltransferase involved in cell wall biosynthesis
MRKYNLTLNTYFQQKLDRYPPKPLKNFINEENKHLVNDQALDLLSKMLVYDKSNPSNYIKELFINYFKNHDLKLEDNRLNTIYNILYEDEFMKIKNTDVAVNKNYITYASAWQKGIEQVVRVFDYAKNVDPELKLVLLSPGYDWNNFTDYSNKLKEKYKDDIIIHGPVNKEQYSKIIKESMVVLTTTFSETFGCVFAETYYLGTPVIMDYRSGAVKEIIDNEYIVNFDNKKETIDKILYVKKNRDNIHVHLDDKFMLEYNIQLWLKLLK